MKNLLVLLAAVICGATSVLGQDVLYLKNGSSIQGELVNKIAQNTKEQQIQNHVVPTKEYNYSFVTASNDTSNTMTREYRYTTSYSSQQDNDIDEINRRKAKKGYRGFVAISPGYYVSNGVGSLEISTTHGFQINHYCFVGGGIGVDIIGDAEDYLLNSSGIAIPIYAAFSGNVGSRVAQFSYGTRIGSCIWSASNILSGATSLMWNVNVGLRLGFTPTFGLSITPDISLMAASDFFDARIGLRVGIDF